MKSKALYIVLGLLAFTALLAYMSMGMMQHRVEVCVEFRGQSNCRTASGSTREKALRTATENACATISSGMTDTRTCETSQPLRVDWK